MRGLFADITIFLFDDGSKLGKAKVKAKLQR